MTTFLLIRHGETGATGRILAGSAPGWHLNEAGRTSVERLARELSRLRVRAVYSSPLERARETAEPLALAWNKTVNVSEEIGEMRFGEWEGRTFAELDRIGAWRLFNEHRSSERPPGGESAAELQSRMARSLDGWRAEHPDGLVAVVSHLDPLRALLCCWLGMPLDNLVRFDMAPASVSVVQVESWGFRVLRLNGTGGLAV